MVDLIQIRQMVEKCWSFETSYCHSVMDWEDFRDLAYMQCATTTDLLHFLYAEAGFFMRGMVKGQPHYWYRIYIKGEDGEANYFNIDLTWRQFPAGTEITDIQRIGREEMVSNEWMEQRCRNMREAFERMKLERMAEIALRQIEKL